MEPLQDCTTLPTSHAESVRYIAQTFLSERHYKKLYETLAQRWDRLHSLSAAVRLMQTYGVELSEEEMARLANLDEGQQINELVAKMPKQSNDQFQHFFLQLQLLVSTAMRVRRALEEGRADEVAEALEEADATGIATYILRVAVVQAGNEVMTLRDQFQAWCKEADSKLGRLIRGQQDAMAAQKKLAAAQAELNKHTSLANARAAKVVMSFAQADDKAVSALVFNGWASAAKLQAMESRIDAEYSDRQSVLERHLAELKERQINNGHNMVLKKWKEEQAQLMEDVYQIWRRIAEEQKFVRESGAKVEALQEQLEQAKTSQKENAARVMASFAAATDRGLKELVLKSWIDVMKDVKVEREMAKEQNSFESRIKAMNVTRMETTKRIISMVAGSSDGGLLAVSLQAWETYLEDSRREKHLDTMLQESNVKLQKFAKRNKASATSAMRRAADSIDAGSMIRYFGSWRTWAKMESIMRKHHAMIDSKRSQLLGVQQMFRDFAKQLDAGVKESGPSTRAWDYPEQGTPGKRLSKSENTTSLPDIHKGGSGRRSKESSSGRPHVPPIKGHSRDHSGSAAGEGIPARPKAAWN